MLGAIIGSALGAIAGGAGNSGSQNSSSSSSVSLRDINDLNKGRSALEGAGDSASMDQLTQLLNLVNAGPGASAVTDALSATNNYANMLQNMSTNSGAPNQNQVDQATRFARQVFAPQQVSLDQQFNDQNIQAQRMAARLGRPGSDPILANKIAFGQGQLQQQLDAQKSAFGAQYADQLAGRQLDMSGQLMNIRNGLATQAFNNRQTLLQLGQQLVQNERNYRVNTGTRNSSGSSTSSSGGGIGGAISGAIAGFGAGAGAQAKLGGFDFGSMFGGSSTGGGGTDLTDTPTQARSGSSLSYKGF